MRKKNETKSMYEIYTYIEYLGDDNFKKFQELRKAEYDNDFQSGSISFEMNGTYDEESIVAFNTLEEVFAFLGDDKSSLAVRTADFTEEELQRIKENMEA